MSLPGKVSLTITLGILILLVSVSHIMGSRSFLPPPTDLQHDFPRVIGSYKATDDVSLDSSVMDILQLSDFINRAYISNNNAVWLYVGYVNSQDSMPLIHTPTGCLPGGGNEITHRELVPWWNGGDGRQPVKVNLLYLEKGQDLDLVVYWYQERGRIIANDYMERLDLFLDAVRYGRTDGALVRFIRSKRSSESLDDAKNDLKHFVQLAIPELQKVLPGKIRIE